MGAAPMPRLFRHHCRNENLWYPPRRKEILTVRTTLVLTLAAFFTFVAVPRPTSAQKTPATTRAAAAATAPGHNFARWEKDIAAYEAKDRTDPPPKGCIVFIGSSTILRWKTLAQDFPVAQVINRGFGGSEIIDAAHFADRIVIPYAPQQVFLRAGTNDIHAGKSAQQVFQDYQQFVATIHDKLPETEIVFISSAPAPSRWKERDTNKQLNDLVEAYCEGKPYLKYVETYDTTITPDGQPREELFVKDRLHFNEAGYKILADRVRPYVKK
jgi:lysophospholipase L1-like esterase